MLLSTCCRVFDANPIKDILVEKLVAGIKQRHVGDPMDPATDVGPLIRPGEVDRVERWVNAAIEADTKCAQGGKRISDIRLPNLTHRPTRR